MLEERREQSEAAAATKERVARKHAENGELARSLQAVQMKESQLRAQVPSRPYRELSAATPPPLQNRGKSMERPWCSRFGEGVLVESPKRRGAQLGPAMVQHEDGPSPLGDAGSAGHVWHVGLFPPSLRSHKLAL